MSGKYAPELAVVDEGYQRCGHEAETHAHEGIDVLVAELAIEPAYAVVVGKELAPGLLSASTLHD